jgi:hypothetical protein
MIAPAMPTGPQTKNAAIDVTSEPMASAFVDRAGGYAYGGPYGDRGGGAVGGVSSGSLMPAE